MITMANKKAPQSANGVPFDKKALELISDYKRIFGEIPQPLYAGRYPNGDFVMPTAYAPVRTTYSTGVATSN
jgi:hypothetical protein